MAGRISFILNQAEIARGPVDAQKFLSAAHNLLREKGLILRYGLVSVIEWEKFEKAVSEVSHKAITKGIKGHDFEEIRRESGVKEIMMTLETKLADNRKVIEREEDMNSRPGWIKKTAIGLAAVVGWGIATANLPNDYVNIGPTTAYAETLNSVRDLYQRAQPTNELENGRTYTGYFQDNSKNITFKNNEWSQYYFDSNYGPKIKSILMKDKRINFSDFDRFMNKNRYNISSSSMYYEGFMTINVKSLGYGIIFPVSEETVKKINEL